MTQVVPAQNESCVAALATPPRRAGRCWWWRCPRRGGPGTAARCRSRTAPAWCCARPRRACRLRRRCHRRSRGLGGCRAAGDQAAGASAAAAPASSSALAARVSCDRIVIVECAFLIRESIAGWSRRRRSTARPARRRRCWPRSRPGTGRTARR